MSRQYSRKEFTRSEVERLCSRVYKPHNDISNLYWLQRKYHRCHSKHPVTCPHKWHNQHSAYGIEGEYIAIIEEQVKQTKEHQQHHSPQKTRSEIDTLLRLIDRSGKKDSEVYKRANISRQHFSKIRKDPAYQPTKPTALAFALALELDLDQTRDLIGRAGFALTTSSKFDVIVMYFISQKRYDLFEINTTLFEFDQPLLGA